MEFRKQIKLSEKWNEGMREKEPSGFHLQQAETMNDMTKRLEKG